MKLPSGVCSGRLTVSMETGMRAAQTCSSESVQSLASLTLQRDGNTESFSDPPPIIPVTPQKVKTSGNSEEIRESDFISQHSSKIKAQKNTKLFSFIDPLPSGLK